MATRAARGRIDKRQAILDAALMLFAERGYEQACVQEIADRAGVAKPTIYNHLDDKVTLLRETVEVTTRAVHDQCATAIEHLRQSGKDLPAALTDMAVSLLTICTNPRTRALHRVTYAQASTLPELLELVHKQTSDRTIDTLGDRFARLMLAGQIRNADPIQAAEQFIALLTGPLQRHSRLGIRDVSTSDTHHIAVAAVDTFMRAYASEAPNTNS